MAAKLSAYTGLSTTFIKEANLRVDPSRFRKELLRGEREILGRYDARFEGTDFDAAGDTPGYDPSSTGITGAFVAAFHDYLERELKFSSTETYYVSGPNLIRSWDWNHRAPGERQPLREPYVAGDLADAMRKDPRLRVLSVNGLYDLATPFFKTEFDLAHMNLDPKLRQNIEFAYYPSGHMIYLNVEALKATPPRPRQLLFEGRPGRHVIKPLRRSSCTVPSARSPALIQRYAGTPNRLPRSIICLLLSGNGETPNSSPACDGFAIPGRISSRTILLPNPKPWKVGGIPAVPELNLH